MSGRWRCKRCGSTRIDALFEGVVTARLDPDSPTPRMGEVVCGFDDHGDMAEGSLDCKNCGHGEARYEADRHRAAQGEGDS